jgi:hypothetical protein
MPRSDPARTVGRPAGMVPVAVDCPSLPFALRRPGAAFRPWRFLPMPSPGLRLRASSSASPAWVRVPDCSRTHAEQAVPARAVFPLVSAPARRVASAARHLSRPAGRRGVDAVDPPSPGSSAVRVDTPASRREAPLWTERPEQPPWCSGGRSFSTLCSSYLPDPWTARTGSPVRAPFWPQRDAGRGYPDGPALATPGGRHRAAATSSVPQHLSVRLPTDWPRGPRAPGPFLLPG